MEVFIKPDCLIGAEPFDVVSEMILQHPEIRCLNLWKYTYKPQIFNENKSDSSWVDCSFFTGKNNLNKIGNRLEPDEQIALSSRVLLLNGEYANIPLMEFSLKKSEQNLNIIKERLIHSKSVSGWLLETGSSYHFYGNAVLTDNEWIDFMGKCLLTSIVHTRDDIEQIADTGFIGHSLRRGCATLRITTRADKDFIPRVVEYVK